MVFRNFIKSLLRCFPSSKMSPKASEIAPKCSQKTPKRLPRPPQEAPRALQEAPKGLSEGLRVEDTIRNAFWIRFGLQKESPGPQNALFFIENQTLVFEEITFSARVASWTRFWTLLASLSGAFWPPRWLKPVLEFLLERPRAVQDYFFGSAPWPTKPWPQQSREETSIGTILA